MSSVNKMSNQSYRIENGMFYDVTSFRLKGMEIVGMLVVFEYFLLWMKNKQLPDVSENVMSMAHGFFNEIGRFLFRTVEFNAYLYAFSNFALFDSFFTQSSCSLPVAMLLIDFAYYWFHRASHEIMIFWAVHQVHHTSEELTVSVGLRHSPLQNMFSWIFYLPFAIVGLPPSHMVFHLQAHLLYQTWIHTCSIDNMGPLEYILNTPSHHRVHHGSNKYCLDKNYGGLLILWDYLFGTFTKEKEGVVIGYGILRSIDNQNIFWNQIFYIVNTVEKAKTMKGWGNYISAYIKGPSWLPGSSWTASEISVGRDMEKYPPRRRNASIVLNTYAILQIIVSYFLFTSFVDGLSSTLELKTCGYITLALLTLHNLGLMYDGNPSVGQWEVAKSFLGLLLILSSSFAYGFVKNCLLTVYFLAIIFWFTVNPTTNALKLLKMR